MKGTIPARAIRFGPHLLAATAISTAGPRDAAELVWDGLVSNGQVLASSPYVYRVTLTSGHEGHTGSGVIVLER
jgi:hypothetical protein